MCFVIVPRKLEKQEHNTWMMHIQELKERYPLVIKLCIDEAVRRDRLSIGYIKGILENRNEWGTVEN